MCVWGGFNASQGETRYSRMMPRSTLTLVSRVTRWHGGTVIPDEEGSWMLPTDFHVGVDDE